MNFQVFRAHRRSSKIQIISFQNYLKKKKAEIRWLKQMTKTNVKEKNVHQCCLQ